MVLLFVVFQDLPGFDRCSSRFQVDLSLRSAKFDISLVLTPRTPLSGKISLYFCVCCDCRLMRMCCIFYAFLLVVTTTRCYNCNLRHAWPPVDHACLSLQLQRVIEGDGWNKQQQTWTQVICHRFDVAHISLPKISYVASKPAPSLEGRSRQSSFPLYHWQQIKHWLTDQSLSGFF